MFLQVRQVKVTPCPPKPKAKTGHFAPRDQACLQPGRCGSADLALAPGLVAWIFEQALCVAGRNFAGYGFAV